MLYKHVLIAVDESDTSNLALKEGIRFAKEFPDTSLRIVHVGDEFFINWDGQPVVTPNDEQKTLKDAGFALLQNIELELRTANISNFETRFIESDKRGSRVSEKIAEEAKAWPADLIIIGTHGRRGFHRLFLGSVAEGLVRIATMPVLLIRCK